VKKRVAGVGREKRKRRRRRRRRRREVEDLCKDGGGEVENAE
jgi:hypothetical protein